MFPKPFWMGPGVADQPLLAQIAAFRAAPLAELANKRVPEPPWAWMGRIPDSDRALAQATDRALRVPPDKLSAKVADRPVLLGMPRPEESDKSLPAVPAASDKPVPVVADRPVFGRLLPCAKRGREAENWPKAAQPE